MAGGPGRGGSRRPAGRSSAISDGLGEHRLIEIVALDDTLYAVTVVGRQVRAHAVGPVAAAVREVDLARFMLRRLAHGRPPPGALAALDAAGRRLQETLLGDAVADLDGGPVVVVPPGSAARGALGAAAVAARHVGPGRAVGGDLAAGRAGPAAASAPGRAGHRARARRHGRRGVRRSPTGYPDTVVLADGQATADRTLAALDGAWTAHIAAHGVFRADNPLFSSLLLDDGPLTVYDLGRLRRAPLRLVLSSCESGGGRHTSAPTSCSAWSARSSRSEPRACWPASCRSTTRATVGLMVGFHEQVLAGVVVRRRPGGGPAIARPTTRSRSATALSFVALGPVTATGRSHGHPGRRHRGAGRRPEPGPDGAPPDSADQKPAQVCRRRAAAAPPPAYSSSHPSRGRPGELPDEIQAVAVVADLEVDLDLAAGERQQPSALAAGATGPHLLELRGRAGVGSAAGSRRGVGDEHRELAVQVAGVDRGPRRGADVLGYGIDLGREPTQHLDEFVVVRPVDGSSSMTGDLTSSAGETRPGRHDLAQRLAGSAAASGRCCRRACPAPPDTSS